MHIYTDTYILTQHSGPGPQVDVVADLRVSVAILLAGTAQSHSLQVYVEDVHKTCRRQI